MCNGNLVFFQQVEKASGGNEKNQHCYGAQRITALEQGAQYISVTCLA